MFSNESSFKCLQTRLGRERQLKGAGRYDMFHNEDREMSRKCDNLGLLWYCTW